MLKRQNSTTSFNPLSARSWKCAVTLETIYRSATELSKEGICYPISAQSIFSVQAEFENTLPIITYVIMKYSAQSAMLLSVQTFILKSVDINLH